VGPSSGSLTRGQSSTLTLSASVAGLALGSYSGSVTVQDVNAANSPRAIAVNLTVSERPTIGLSPTSMTFVNPCNESNPDPQPLTITNTGGSTLQWQRTVDGTAPDFSTPWLSATPSSGALTAGQSETITVSADISNAPWSSDVTGTLTFTDSDASNSPRVLNVTLVGCGIGLPQQR
jgi:hypothetical protein